MVSLTVKRGKLSAGVKARAGRTTIRSIADQKTIKYDTLFNFV